MQARSTPANPSNRGNLLLLIVAILAGAPAVVTRFGGVHMPPLETSIVNGLGILGAAMMLSWAAEAAEKDISQGLAVALLALIAVLPEYAVDAVFAWKAAYDPASEELAIANMTGGNRLLIGFAWPLVVGIFYYKRRFKTLAVGKGRALELAFLFAATAYSFSFPIFKQIALWDSAILVSMFIAYLYMASRGQVEEPELIGPARMVGELPKAQRRTALAAIFLYAGLVIFCAAEPFAEGLVEMGEEFGIDEFLLVQWLAPLASEAPEILIASMLAWRGKAAVGMSALISSKVNQWTLLVGTLPIIYAISAGSPDPFPLSDRQAEEMFLTSAQSLFAVAVLVNLRISIYEAGALFVLFATQLFITAESVRIMFGVAYIVLAIGVFLTNRKDIPTSLRYARDQARGQIDERAPEPVGGG